MPARALSKAHNRQTLLETTADLIAQGGVEAASVSAICARAGLSRGMVHLHFDNKDALLLEVVRDLNARYFAGIDAALQHAPGLAFDQVMAVVRADLGPTLLNRRTVNLWYAFRGLSRARPDILQYSDTRDTALRAHLMRAFNALEPHATHTGQRARDATHGTLALLEGMWADFYLHTDRFNRQTAIRIVRRFIVGLYPETASELD
ncbi:MAG: TetR family transcriptional regulator C-terminal domain-containing protein [Pseudomonadota bacterium]